MSAMLSHLPAQGGFLSPMAQGRPAISPRQKAAIIVRLLLAEGTPISLSSLPEEMQAALAAQMGKMRRVDRTTLAEVVSEFVAELEEVGLSFPGGLEGALSIMDGHISSNAATRLRRMNGGNSTVDPWERLLNVSLEILAAVLEEESVEVAAVVLSKLPIQKAAELLGKLPGERARRVAYAVSQTGNIDPDTVRRIGMSIATQVDQQPIKAFEVNPGERVGAILNIAAALTRDDVLKGLQETDAEFAHSDASGRLFRQHLVSHSGVSGQLRIVAA